MILNKFSLYYMFLKFLNLNDKHYLIFENLEINKINFNTKEF